VSFKLKEDNLWANAGHEVAFGQYVYTVKEDAVGVSMLAQEVEAAGNTGAVQPLWRVLQISA